MNMTTSEAPQFEQTLQRLEQLLNKMEGGQLPLEESIKLYEEGVELVQTCQTVLQNAEQRVLKVMEKNGQTVLEKMDGLNTDE